MEDSDVLMNDAKSINNEGSLQDEVGMAPRERFVGVFGDHSNDEKIGVVCSITIDGKPVVLNNFFGVPDTTPMSLNSLNVTTGKLYSKTENISAFVDSKLMDDWKVSEK
jgi:hypothetical protein